MLLKGDCVEAMKCFDANTFHAIVCDPPYNLHFMGKAWDKDLLHAQWLKEAFRVLKPGGSMLVMGGTRTFHRLMVAIEDTGFIIKDTLMWMYGSGFPKAQDITPHIDAKTLGITTKQVKERREIIGTEIAGNGLGLMDKNSTIGGKFNITKPLTPEAAAWNGFRVGGIKPAYEPIVWGVKPPDGSYTDNVLKYGVGAVNVEATRVSYRNNDDKKIAVKERPNAKNYDNSKDVFSPLDGLANRGSPQGRFPANVILSHHPECVQVGVKRVKGSHDTTGVWGTNKQGSSFRGYGTHGDKKQGHVDPDGLEIVESWSCHPDCPIRLLDEQSGDCKTGSRNGKGSKTAFFRSGGHNVDNSWKGDSGGASRFFYCAKASRSERNAGLEGMDGRITGHKSNFRCTICGHQQNSGTPCKCANPEWEEVPLKPQANIHPTCKPISLFKHLVSLVTRKGQTVLDPFMGSGTTGCACAEVEREFIGIEKEDEYIEIAKKRIEYWENKEKQMELFT